jgi:hypothetical protein
VRLHLGGPDARVALRDEVPSAEELEMIIGRLETMDRSRRTGPWTLAVLCAIRDHPGLRAPDLAESFGRESRLFKADVRRLKELGLTESLPVGYRLSSRGVDVIASIEAGRV